MFAMHATLVLLSLCRRPFLIGMVSMAAMPAGAVESRETIRLVTGAGTVIALMENASTGYRWQLNGAASRNLSLVGVSDAGVAAGGRGKPLFGAPGTRRLRIMARKPGKALVVFDYTRPWEHVAAIRRRVVRIDILRR